MFSTSIMQKGRRQREESAKTRHGTGGNGRGGGVKTGSWKPGMENQREGLALQREVLGEGGADPSVLMTVGLIKSQSCQTFYKSSFFLLQKVRHLYTQRGGGGGCKKLIDPHKCFRVKANISEAGAQCMLGAGPPFLRHQALWATYACLLTGLGTADEPQPMWPPKNVI